jgi:hypothetical protein
VIRDNNQVLGLTRPNKDLSFLKPMSPTANTFHGDGYSDTSFNTTPPLGPPVYSPPVSPGPVNDQDVQYSPPPDQER